MVALERRCYPDVIGCPCDRGGEFRARMAEGMMSLTRRSIDRGSRSDRDLPGAGPGPGKRTLTEALAPGRAPAPSTDVPSNHGRALDDPDRVQQITRCGVAGPGEPLPHLDRIQRLFGRHDLGGVRAHSDPGAAGAAGALGAEAFASGQDVAFAGAPSLHTAAHEAAHTVQQRAGVACKGGIGAEGDAHERHADAVADRVVRGESAEALLDAPPGNAGGTAVQRKVTIGGLDTTTSSYGPGEQDLDSLVALVEAQRIGDSDVQLKPEQRDRLQLLWQSGDHHFLTPEELVHEVLDWGSDLTLLPSPPPGGYRPPTQATDRAGKNWFISSNTDATRPP